MSDLEQAFTTLMKKRAEYNKLFAYYDGNQPVMYTARRLEAVFQGLDAVFTENWCAVVVDACKDRINLAGFEAANEALKGRLEALLSTNELLLEADEVHEATLVVGEGYVIAWLGEDGQPEAYFNDPRLCHVFYDAQNPRKKRYAAKWWTGDDAKLHMTLYYPDRLEYYISTAKAESVTTAAGLRPDIEKGSEGVGGNDTGEVPVFHFRTSRRQTRSELRNVVPVQNGINKLLADMLVAAEFGAFRQRWVISNADTETLKNAPNEVWNVPAGDGMGQQTSVGQFDATDLSNYLKAIDNLSGALSSITRTPKHYFFGQGDTPSGEALIALEAPLNKKAQDFIDRFGPVWQQVMAYLLKLGGAQVTAEDIRPVWTRPETVQPRTKAEIQQLRVASGEPLVTVLRSQGASEAELEQLAKDQADERAASANSLAQALIEQQRRLDQNAGAPLPK